MLKFDETLSATRELGVFDNGVMEVLCVERLVVRINLFEFKVVSFSED